MEIRVLNGLSAQESTGFSRVNSGLSYDDKPLNGFSRVNLNGGSDYTLNGNYTLNGAMNEVGMNDEDKIDFLLEMLMAQPEAINGCRSINGLKDWFAKRRAKKAERQERRSERRERRSERKDLRQEKRRLRRDRLAAKVASKQSGEPGFLDKAINAVGNFLGGGEMPSDMADEIAEMQMIMMDAGEEVDAMDERGLFGPPSLFKDPGGWFSSKKVPTWQKVGVVAVGAAALDLTLNKGKIVKPILGMKVKK